MYTLRVKSHFGATHLLPWHSGKCKNLHGHRWEVEVVLEAEELDENGIVVDFGMVKEVLSGMLPDHQPLNVGEYLNYLANLYPEYEFQLNSLAGILGNWIENPTAERIAEKLFNDLKPWLTFNSERVNLVEVTVWESPKCSAIYRPPSEPKTYNFFPTFLYNREKAEPDPIYHWDNQTTEGKP